MLTKNAILNDKYRILQTLGNRGMSGYTYLAETVNQSTQYAIKELDPKSYEPEEVQEINMRFETEANYLKRLAGFNGQIPKFYDYFKNIDSEGIERNYIVQEYIEGQTLSQYMKSLGRAMSEPEVKNILSQLLPVVEYIHQKGFIHRDIKPDNIILRIDNNLPVLIDFGAVKEYEITLIRKGPAQTLAIGTEGYYDEDQANGKPTATSDLYALGAVAVFLLTNTLPRTINRYGGKMLWESYVLGLSQDFMHFIDKAIEPRTSYAGQRFESAQAMIYALNQVASEKEIADELTKLATRKWVSLNGKTIKCRECDFYLAFENKNCTNCGAFNIYCLSEDEIELFYSSPKYYFDKKYSKSKNIAEILQFYSNKDKHLINGSVDDYIKKYTRFLAALPGYLIWDKPTKESTTLNETIKRFYYRNKLRGFRGNRKDLYELNSIAGKRPFRITLAGFLDKYSVYLVFLGIAVWIGIGALIGLNIQPLLEAISGGKNPAGDMPPACLVVITVLIAICTAPLVGKIMDLIINVLYRPIIEVFNSLETLRGKFYRKKDNLKQDLIKEIDRKEKVLLSEIRSRKKLLDDKKNTQAVKYRKTGFYLRNSESNINKQLDSIKISVNRLKELLERLESHIKDTPTDFLSENQKSNKERISAALKSLTQQDLKYNAKLSEIELLRLNNVLQAETVRQKITKKDRDETKKKIDEMAKLSQKIHNNLKTSIVAKAGSEQVWLKRIFLVTEALMKLRESLFNHIVDLAHNGLEENESDLPLAITTGLDRLNAYLTNEDFEKEYQLLEAKY